MKKRKLGAEVRRRRRLAGLTLEQLAERAGLTANYIGEVENNKADPSVSTIVALAKGLAINAGDFFPRSDISPAGMHVGKLSDEAPSGLQRGILMLLEATTPKK